MKCRWCGGYAGHQLVLPEVNGATVVGVKCPEDIFTEVVSIPAGEYLGVHLHELFLGQLTRGTILQESIVPALNAGLVQLSLGLQERHVLDREFVLAGVAPHH